jgi:hypothetical protein
MVQALRLMDMECQLGISGTVCARTPRGRKLVLQVETRREGGSNTSMAWTTDKLAGSLGTNSLRPSSAQMTDKAVHRALRKASFFITSQKSNHDFKYNDAVTVTVGHLDLYERL